MKRIYEWLGGFALLLFSFYFTDKVSEIVIDRTTLMQEIKTVSKNNNEEPMDAVINNKDNSIIPGKYGKKINYHKSYASMKEFGIFNENYLVYDKIKPDKTVEENKDKYIISGNPNNRNISIIIEEDQIISNYLNQNSIKYDVIATRLTKIREDKEYINGEYDKKYFIKLNSHINKNLICLKNYSNLEECLKYDYYIIDTHINLNNDNINNVLNQLNNGSIILIRANTDLKYINLLLNEIKQKDLNPVYISDLIKEE